MAKSAVIGSLRVNLGLDSAQFQAGLDRASKSMDVIAKRAARYGAVVGTAMAGAATAMSVAVSRVIRDANKLGDVADRLGVGVEALQELRHAAERGGMEINNFDVALRRFVRRSSEAAQGVGAAKDAFKALGVELRDANGGLKPTEQLLGEVADAMQKVPNQADKLALAFKMFDTDGAAMVKVLADGSKGIEAFREEARRLGIVLSEDSVRGAQAFSDNMDTIRKAMGGIVTQVTSHLLPALELLSEKIVEFSTDGETLKTISEGIAEAFGWAWKAAVRLTAGLKGVAIQFVALGKAISLANQYQFSAARDAWNEGAEQAAALLRDAEKTIKDTLSGGFISQGMISRRISAAFGDAGEESGEEFVYNFSKSAKSAAERTNAFEQLAQSMQDSMAQLQVDAATVGMPLGEAVAYTAQMDLLRAAHEANIPVTAQLLEQINMLSESFALANLQLEGARLGMELMNDPFSLLNQEMVRLNELLNAGVISWEQWSDAALRARMVVATEVLSLAGQLTGALGKMFGDSKEFAIAEAVINTAQAVTKTLAHYGATPWGLAAAGVAAAAGAAQIATISRTNKGSKSAPSVRGGSVGSGGGGGQREQAVTINLHGESYSQQSVEGLLAQINEAISDGHKLIIRTV